MAIARPPKGLKELIPAPNTAFGHRRRLFGIPGTSPIPLGVCSISEIVNGGYLYIDKTKSIRRLITIHPFCFLGRPRGFGKTLLLDTIREIFGGNKELFKRYFIYRSGNYPWDYHPVISLDLKVQDVDKYDKTTLRRSMLNQLRPIVKSHGLHIKGHNPEISFYYAVRDLFKLHNTGVVLLVDNFDSPYNTEFKDPTLARYNHDLLWGVMKKLNVLHKNLRFVMFAGLFRYPYPNLFRRILHVYDLSYDIEFCRICGVSVKELDIYCYDHMKEAAEQLRRDNVFGPERTTADFRREILHWYNGYSFDGRTTTMNPLSVLQALKNRRCDYYWYDGQPSEAPLKMVKGLGLTHNIYREDYSVRRTDTIRYVDRKETVAYLLQTGYFTVRKWQGLYKDSNLLLRVPNYEIRTKMFLYFLCDGRHKDTRRIIMQRQAYVHQALRERNLVTLEAGFRALMQSIYQPYYMSDQDFFNQQLYMAARTMFTSIDETDPPTDGVIDGFVSYFGGDLYIVQLRSANLEWITLETEPFLDFNNTILAPPWRLPPNPRRLDFEDTVDNEWNALNTFLDLTAQMCITNIDERKLPLWFFGLVTPATRVYKVGVAVYKREKVRVVIEEAVDPNRQPDDPDAWDWGDED